MHEDTLKQWQHQHDFSKSNPSGEKRTLAVLILTAVTMIAEISAGVAFGSMALLADGWHMGTHVAAFGITIFAYRYARRHAKDMHFTFGTGKVSVLGGYSSAVALAVVALVMALESVGRFFNPHEIRFNEAIIVAFLGLIINIISALILQGKHEHGHHHHHDHNLKAAYLHVLADALTSVFAIVALFAGKHLGWQWMDPMMGIVGAIIITRWSYLLLSDTGHILLDRSNDAKLAETIKNTIESDSDNRIADLHLWEVSPSHYAVILSLVTHYPKSPNHYKELLHKLPQLSHITVEINPCSEASCMAQNGETV